MDKERIHAEAEAIRQSSPNGRPQPLGTAFSFGFGDRLGLATPGHIEALRNTRPPGLLPVFAQQSGRELTRTGRSFQEVMDAAAVAVHKAGWTDPWGADADHLKSGAQIKEAIAAGYTMFTLDPSDAIKSESIGLEGKDLIREFNALFETKADRKTYLDRYAGSRVEFATGETFQISDGEARRVAVVYLRAIAILIWLARKLDENWRREERFDLEISIDETSVPTTPEAHWIIASELDRAGIYFTAIAPRFVGRFEKGVDYRGSLSELEDHIALHAEIARTLGPYKLSLHSGSDKFSVYPLLVRHAGELVHVKTAGTSYLEALRVVCRKEPALFREIAVLSRGVFETARDTYALSTDVSRIPEPNGLSDDALEAAFLNAPENDDARQMLHVAYGDLLCDTRLGTGMFSVLDAHPQEYDACLQEHFVRHLSKLC